jgi:hypothetical protein
VDILSSDIISRLFVCYRPPSGNAESAAVQYTRDLCNCILSLFPSNGSAIICGDFNLANIDWAADNGINCTQSTCSGVLLDFYYATGVHQLVTESTRGDHILDLIFCSDVSRVLNVRVAEPFSTSDHNQAYFDIVCKASTPKQTFNSYDFEHADWSQIRSFLTNIDFFDLFHCDLLPTDRVDSFYNIINTCIDLYVPIKHSVFPGKPRCVRYPPGIRRKLRKKACAWRIYRSFRTPESLVSYRKIASECKSAIYAFELYRENQLINNGNTGAFFRYANKKFCGRPAVGPLHDSNGSLTSVSIEKAAILQRTFSHNFTVDNGVLPCPSSFSKPPAKLSYIHFTPTLVRRAIKRLNKRTKGGPDGIPPSFFINCREELCYPLSLLFSCCFDHCIIPAVWLMSYITPIYKKGNAADASNYRPISLTATMSKLMESVIKDQMVQFLVDKGILNKHQHAFINKHSTASNLLECIRDWQIGLNSRSQTDVVYIDFSKAFDSIVHSKLLFKLELYGITGLLLRWIEVFLSNRLQRVVLDYCFSPVCDVISGVPQGSVLGPILFLIYVNDIDSVCCGNTALQLFADDAKLYSQVEMNNSSVSLQQTLHLLSQWASDWQLTINVDKLD